MDLIITDSELFAYLILPILIFFARILDVTIGTLRIIFVSKGDKIISPILGFFEVFIWIVVISQIIGNIDNYICYIAYAGGFAMGNYVGLRLEERMAIGKVLVRVISAKGGSILIKNLNERNFGATMVEGEGSTGPVKLIYIIIDRKKLDDVINVIQEFNPKSFFSIEDVRRVSSGIFPAKTPVSHLSVFRRWRRGK